MMYGPDMMMGSIWHWIIFIIFAALVIYPLGRILGRIGFSPFWSVLAFIPIVNLIGLWVLALSNWPRRDVAQTDTRSSKAHSDIPRV